MMDLLQRASFRCFKAAYLLLFFCLAYAGQCDAQSKKDTPVADNGTVAERKPRSLGFGIGLSLSKQVQLNHSQRSGTELFLMHPQLLVPLGDRLTFIQEGVIGASLYPRKNSVFGTAEIIRFHFKPRGRLEAFVEGGAGVNAFSLRLPELGRKMEFSLQAGGGIAYRLKKHPNTQVVVMYRPTHFSDAGTVPPNQGINLHMVFVGLNFSKIR